MERECCLIMLVMLIGGAALLVCGWWPTSHLEAHDARSIERVAWRRIWLPGAPALAIVAALCGWALVEPDPVPEKVPWSLALMAVPFALLMVRTAFRGAAALLAIQHDPVIATVGILRPWIVFSPNLAKSLSDRQIEAALEHERAHARHRDPLRIWLAQFLTDLQWPWPQARERLDTWLTALELARDEEARIYGIDGVDLAEAILASARFARQANSAMQAALNGEPSKLKERIRRLIDPLPPPRSQISDFSSHGLLLLLPPVFALALAGGALFGDRLIRMLFWIAA
jgi:hypothetical protein